MQSSWAATSQQVTRALFAFYPVDPDALSGMLSTADRSVQLPSGKAVVLLGWCEHAGLASQFVMATFATRSATRLASLRAILSGSLPISVLELATSSQQNCELTRDLLGFPAFKAEINVQPTRHRWYAEWSEADALVLRMRLDVDKALRVPNPNLELLGLFDRTLPINLRGATRLVLKPRLRLELGEAKHPALAKIDALGLANKSPWVVLADPVVATLKPGFQSVSTACTAESPGSYLS
jgi:hypothetical protein